MTIFGSGGCSGSGTAGTTTITMTSGTTGCVVHYQQDGSANDLSAPDITSSTTAQKAAATVTLSNLSQIYNGTPRPVSVNTNPVGLVVDVSTPVHRLVQYFLLVGRCHLVNDRYRLRREFGPNSALCVGKRDKRAQ